MVVLVGCSMDLICLADLGFYPEITGASFFFLDFKLGIYAQTINVKHSEFSHTDTPVELATRSRNKTLSTANPQKSFPVLFIHCLLRR